MIYIALAVVLCGMVGVTYAITATDADQYITRSQYATDMSYLQLALDEQESSLMGDINRFRSTDVKFVTYDTPTNYDRTSTVASGYHTGGNWFPRRKIRSLGGTKYTYTAPSTTDNTLGRYANINIYRLYNGNYIITPNYGYYNGSVFYQTTVNYAIPCENLPGWYLEVKMISHHNATQCLLSLVKLDPNVSFNDYSFNDILNKELIFRFKKDLFQYAGDDPSSPPSKTKSTATSNYSFYNNNSYIGPFRYLYKTGETTGSTYSLTISKWLDPDTSDYMMSVKGFPACHYSTGINRTMYIDSWAWTVCYVIPVDNVEYVSGNTTGYHFTNGDGLGFPNARAIGTGDTALGDLYWEYEFVDAPNGIKYWHAYRRPRNTTIPGTTGVGEQAAGIHYQIPILY